MGVRSPARAAAARRRGRAALPGADRVGRRDVEPARARCTSCVAASARARPSPSPACAGARRGPPESPPRGALESAAARRRGAVRRAGAYSGLQQGAEQVVFFYVPFALLFALLLVRALDGRARAALPLHPRGARARLQRRRRRRVRDAHDPPEPDVVASNQFQSYFRVNSLFFDPNIYGRFLATVIVLLVAVMLWTARRRVVVLSGIACRAAVRGFGSDAVPVELRSAAGRARGARGASLGPGLDGGRGGQRRGGRRRGRCSPSPAR